MPEKIKDSLIFESEDKIKCLNVVFKNEELDKNNICYIGKKNNQKIDFIVYGDSHILPYYKIFKDKTLTFM